ncbi:TATA-binding protein-associated factor mot1, partial [Spiromyces aspiralis]
RERERKFLDQLMDSSKLEPFRIPIKIHANLRRYQQEGVNWLAFLNRYELHGILCDDMGLGKTLQSICILASDHHFQAQKFRESGGRDMDCAPLPSLVVCPPTLLHHWEGEITQYTDNLRTLVYAGLPQDRRRHILRIASYDVVVTSYDLVRNDIDYLAKVHWNYCILDEGHVIKNARTKLTQAVKRVEARHRLILSGTPVQNHVLELWSLFDFLMPGFLGTEKQFVDQYSKPILASRDAKKSSAAQAEGQAALDALHKQVLPFILRRMKEDVLQDLPPKIIQDYYCELSDIQRTLYDDFVRSAVSAGVRQSLEASESEASAGGEKTAKAKGLSMHIFQALQYMRKLCNHPRMVLTPKHP